MLALTVFVQARELSCSAACKCAYFRQLANEVCRHKEASMLTRLLARLGPFVFLTLLLLVIEQGQLKGGW